MIPPQSGLHQDREWYQPWQGLAGSHLILGGCQGSNNNGKGSSVWVFLCKKSRTILKIQGRYLWKSLDLTHAEALVFLEREGDLIPVGSTNHPLSLDEENKSNNSLLNKIVPLSLNLVSVFRKCGWSYGFILLLKVWAKIDFIEDFCLSMHWAHSKFVLSMLNRAMWLFLANERWEEPCVFLVSQAFKWFYENFCDTFCLTRAECK